MMKYIKRALFVVIIVLVLIGAFYHQKEYKVTPIKFSKVKREKYRNPLKNSKVVVTKFRLGTGHNYSLSMELAVPYEKHGERSDLLKNSSRIQNDFIMNVGEEELKKWVKQRNYQAIKSRFLQIVNRYVDKPIDEVYLCKLLQE